MHLDSERAARRCLECGAGEDLRELRNVQVDGDRWTEALHWVCRSCFTAGVRRDAAERAAFWEAQLAGPEHRREQARAHAAVVAAALRNQLNALGVTPDERTAEFIARHSAG